VLDPTAAALVVSPGRVIRILQEPVLCFHRRAERVASAIRKLAVLDDVVRDGRWGSCDQRHASQERGALWTLEALLNMNVIVGRAHHRTKTYSSLYQHADSREVTTVSRREIRIYFRVFSFLLKNEGP
jgi:hypothetical protein